MKKEHFKGEANEIKGNVKEGIGKVFDDTSMTGGGHVDQAQGKFQKGLGNLKDKVERGIGNVADKLNKMGRKDRDVA